MFRKHYEDANHNFTPSPHLISDTKQKMYEQMLDIEFSDTTSLSEEKQPEEIRIPSKLDSLRKRKLSNHIKLACSLASCTALIVASTITCNHFFHKDSYESNTHIVATGSPDATSSSDLSKWYGNYSGAGDSSLLSISKSDDHSFHFALDVKDGDTKINFKGVAVMTSSSVATFSDDSGTTIEFSFKDGFIHVERNPSDQLSDKVSEIGDFINIDGDIDLSTTEYFSKPRKFASGKTYKIDINNDGKADTIKYEHGILTINDYKNDFAANSSEGLDDTCFYLVDIDNSDNVTDLLIYDQGPSNDPTLTSIYYLNDREVKTSGLSCDIDNLTFNTKGTINGMIRLSVLQTWYGYASWSYSKGTIWLNEQSMYFPVEQSLYNPDASSVKLTKMITLYESADQKSNRVVMKPQTVSFSQTDNKHWVKVEGISDGTSGWLYVTDFDLIPPTNEEATEYFDNLWMAD